MASNLGEGIGNRDTVDIAFRESPLPRDKMCYICGNRAEYQLVAKNSIDNTYWLIQHGTVCNYCLNTHVNPEQYGIRKL